jgi:hypothetical protein
MLLLEHKTLFLELCHSVPLDTRKYLKTSSQQRHKQEQRLAICKNIEQLGGELPFNWLDCELIYLERFAKKLQRILDRQVIGFSSRHELRLNRSQIAARRRANHGELLWRTMPTMIRHSVRRSYV